MSASITLVVVLVACCASGVGGLRVQDGAGASSPAQEHDARLTSMLAALGPAKLHEPAWVREAEHGASAAESTVVELGESVQGLRMSPSLEQASVELARVLKSAKTRAGKAAKARLVSQAASDEVEEKVKRHRELLTGRKPTDRTTNLGEVAAAGDVAFVPLFGGMSAPSRFHLVTKDPKAKVHYTMDGSLPTASSPQYQGKPIAIERKHANERSEVQVKAVSVSNGMVSPVSMITWPVTKAIEPLRKIPAKEELDATEAMIPDATPMLTEVQQEEAAAVELEDKIKVIGNDMMKVLQTVELTEDIHVYQYQATAREKRDDFFDAEQVMKDLSALAIELAAEANRTDFEYRGSRRATLEMEEEYEHLEVEERAISWEAYLAKDKARHVVQRTMDDKAILSANRLYIGKELNKAMDTVAVLSQVADDRMSEAASAKEAAMNMDEAAFLMAELKNAKASADEKQGKKDALDNERKMKKEAEEEESKNGKKEGNESNSTNGTNGTKATNSSKPAIDPAELLEAAVEATDGARDDAMESAQATMEAEESKKAVERAEKSIERHAKAQVIALAAINAENNARQVQLEMQRTMDREVRLAKQHDAQILQMQVRIAGEDYIGRQAANTMVKVETWVEQTKNDVKDQKRMLQRDQEVYKNRKEIYLKARDAQLVAENDAHRSEVSVVEAKEATAKLETTVHDASMERRKAWRAAYKAQGASKASSAALVKLERVVQQQEERANAITAEADAMEAENAAHIEDKQGKLDEANAMFLDSKQHNDYDYEVAANTSIDTMSNALAAHTQARTAVSSTAAAMRTQAEAVFARATSIKTAIAGLDTAAEVALDATEKGDKANMKMMRTRRALTQAEEFLKQAGEELKAASRVAESKLRDRTRAENEAAKAKFKLQQRQGHLVLAESEQERWEKKLGKEQEYGEECAERTTNATNKHESLVSIAQPQWKLANDATHVATTAIGLIEQEEDQISTLCTKGGLAKLADLLEMRKKWTLMYLEDGKLNAGAWSVLHASTEEPVALAAVAATQAQKDLKGTLSEQDQRLASSAMEKAISKRGHANSVMKEEKFRQEKNFADGQNEKNKVKVRKMKKDLAKTSVARADSTLKALTVRVEAMWKKGNANEQTNPKAARFIEKGKFQKVVAMWDFDGAPIGPTGVDNWMNDFASFLESREFGGKLGGKMPNCLKPAVRTRCSQQCKTNGALIQCRNGLLSNGAPTCGFGHVVRTRHQVSSATDAVADYWVCRCNSGVMQFTAKELWAMERHKNLLPKLSYSPSSLDFKLRLHDEELVPDVHMQCFRDFIPWLRKTAQWVEAPCTETPAELHLESYVAPALEAYANVSAQKAVTWQLEALRKRTDCIEEHNLDKGEHPFSKLEALSLPSGDTEAETVFNHVRDAWYSTCLKESEPPSPPANTYPGTTDSAVDIFNLKTTPAVSYDPADWPKASAKMSTQLSAFIAAAEEAEAARLNSESAQDSAEAVALREKEEKKIERHAALKQHTSPPQVHPWKLANNTNSSTTEEEEEEGTEGSDPASRLTHVMLVNAE